MRKKKDITGQRFGSLVALREAPPVVSPCGARQSRWHCRCDCGKEVDVRLTSLTSGKVTHCGCQWKKASRPFGCKRESVFAPDKTGKRHGYLTILGPAEPLDKDGKHRSRWIVHCLLCGRNRTMSYENFKLRSDCGCTHAGGARLTQPRVCQRCGLPIMSPKGCEMYCDVCRKKMKERKKYSYVETCIDGTTVQDVVDYYNAHGTVNKTKIHFGLSVATTRKVLISAGALHDDASDRIQALLDEGKSRSKIAEILGVSRSFVTYSSPYEHEIKFIYKPKK